MRIIAGTHRGRRYLPPKDEKTTRPITDRVKQSLYDRLWSLGALPDPPEDSAFRPAPPEVSPDADPDADPDAQQADAESPESAQRPEPFRVLDIFSGTGSLGLEALSRWADQCTFVDMDRDAIDRLEQNLSDLGLEDKARVVKASALNPVWLAQLKPDSVSLIFLDPPYAISEDEQGQKDLTTLMGELRRVAVADCFLSLRTATEIIPDPVEGWDGPTSHTYGSMTLHFFTNQAPA